MFPTVHIGECSILAYCYVYTLMFLLLKNTQSTKKEGRQRLSPDGPGTAWNYEGKGKEDKFCFVRKYRTQIISCYLLRLNNKQ
jgi:hypothetical protein